MLDHSVYLRIWQHSLGMGWPKVSRLRTLGGSFNNYVDQILPNFDNLPPSSRRMWTWYICTSFPFVHFLLTTCLSLLVHVVKEWPLGGIKLLQQSDDKWFSTWRTKSLGLSIVQKFNFSKVLYKIHREVTSDARYFVVALVMGILHPFLVIFFANHINIYHKTEVQTVILSSSTYLNLNCIKSYNRKHKKFHLHFL